jgi:hypothetical protein
MKTIIVSKWQEEAFAVKVTQLEAARERTNPKKVRLALQALARRKLDAADRAVRKTLRVAEQALWQATGGDFLRSA